MQKLLGVGGVVGLVGVLDRLGEVVELGALCLRCIDLACDGCTLNNLGAFDNDGLGRLGGHFAELERRGNTHSEGNDNVDVKDDVHKDGYVEAKVAEHRKGVDDEEYLGGDEPAYPALSGEEEEQKIRRDDENRDDEKNGIDRGVKELVCVHSVLVELLGELAAIERAKKGETIGYVCREYEVVVDTGRDHDEVDRGERNDENEIHTRAVIATRKELTLVGDGLLLFEKCHDASNILFI